MQPAITDAQNYTSFLRVAGPPLVFPVAGTELEKQTFQEWNEKALILSDFLTAAGTYQHIQCLF